jgi:hypothetical protein
MQFHGRPGRYDGAEREARAARRGVFAASDPLPPRAFRTLHGSCYPKHTDRHASAVAGR